MTSSRHRLSAVVGAALLTLALPLSACSDSDDSGLEDTKPLAAQGSLETELTVLSVTESSAEETPLGGRFSTPLRGVPWLVGYRVDLTGGAPEDFSWGVVPELLSDHWTVQAGESEIQAEEVDQATARTLPCPEHGTEPAEPTLMYGCHVFLVPEGQQIDSITVDEVGTWSVTE